MFTIRFTFTPHSKEIIRLQNLFFYFLTLSALNIKMRRQVLQIQMNMVVHQN